MPQFTPNSTHTATAPITVLPAGLECAVEFYLVDSALQTAAVSYGSFTSTGQQQMIPLTMVMPEVENTYMVYLDVLSGGQVLAVYQATEDVVIAAEAPPEEFAVWMLSFNWQSGPYTPGIERDVEVTVRHECTIPDTVATFNVVLKDNDSVVFSSPSLTEDVTGYGQVTMNFPITMPDVGDYSAYIRGYKAGELVMEDPIGIIAVTEPVGAAFSYSGVDCYSGPQANPNYYWMGFDCNIHNPNSFAVSQQIILYNRRDDGLLMELERTQASLGPGETQHYNFEGSNCSHLYIHQQTLWLEDEAGGKSSSCHP